MRQFLPIVAVLLMCCSDNSEIIDPRTGRVMDFEQMVDRANLDKQGSAVRELAKSGTCTNNSSCRLLPFGHKPCGGPATWLVYTTSIDTVELATMGQAYYEAEKSYNAKWGQASNCMPAFQPDSIVCLDGKGVGFWKGNLWPN